MSAAAGAPALTLLPPLPPERLRAGEMTTEGRRRQVLARRYAAAGVVTGALLPVPLVAAGPYLGDAAYVGLVVSWALLLPGCGLALLLAAALGRTRDDLRALLLAALSLAAGAALIGPAGRLGAEAYVSSHAVEMDALAAERAAWHPPAVGAHDMVRIDLGLVGTKRGRALKRLGLSTPRAVPGGLLFEAHAPFTPAVLYADPSFDGVPGGCANPRVSPVGGRWFLYECRTRRANSGH